MAPAELPVDRSGGGGEERAGGRQPLQARAGHRVVRAVHAAGRGRRAPAAVHGHAAEAGAGADVRVENGVRRGQRAQQRGVRRPQQPVRGRADRRAGAAQVRPAAVSGQHTHVQRHAAALLHQGVVRTGLRGPLRPGSVEIVAAAGAHRRVTGRARDGTARARRVSAAVCIIRIMSS